MFAFNSLYWVRSFDHILVERLKYDKQNFSLKWVESRWLNVQEPKGKGYIETTTILWTSFLNKAEKEAYEEFLTKRFATDEARYSARYSA